MKKNKGLTLIEVLIVGSIVVIISVIWSWDMIQNIKIALKKKAELDRLKKHGGYTIPVQEIREQVNMGGFTITKIGQSNGMIFFILKDPIYPNEFLVVQDMSFGGVGITKR